MTKQASSIYLLGGTSIVGWNILRHNRSQPINPFCNPYTNLPECKQWNKIDLEDKNAFHDLFAENPPQLVIHCAGICDVDKCEAEPDWANSINVKSVKNLLNAIPKPTRLVYCSSDHVFSGDTGPYNELSPPDPISVYGKTRVEAEKWVRSKKENSLIIRYGIGIGPSIGGRTGHLNWLQYRKENGLPMTIIADEFRSVVSMRNLVDRIMALSLSNKTGIRHITADKVVSRLQLARYLNQEHQIGAHFEILNREQLEEPHLGRVELTTMFNDDLATPLPSIVPSFAMANER